MSALTLAAHDAAKNCARDGAVAVVSMKSGLTFAGFLERPTDNLYAEGATLHMRPREGEGWETILYSEVAAIGVKKPPAF